MQWLHKVGIVLWLCPALAGASDFVCGDTTKVHQYTQAVDPAAVPLCPAPFGLSEIPAAEIPAQAHLYTSHEQAGTLRYLKVVSGLMAEMTPAEKEAVDAPLLLQQEARNIAANEVTTNEVCANNTLTEITAYWKGPGGKQEHLQATIATLDTAIAALAAGPPKTALQAARDALVAHMTMFINDSELSWRYLCSRTFLRP